MAVYGPSLAYYSLHVPGDLAMTIRSREYLDQPVSFVCVAFYLPDGVRPGAKEHPARQGAVDFYQTRDSISRRDDLVLLDPSLNDFQGMQEAAPLSTVHRLRDTNTVSLPDRPPENGTDDQAAPRLQGWVTDLIGSERTPRAIVTVMTRKTLAWSALPRGETAGYFPRYGMLDPTIVSENIGEVFSIVENMDNQAIAFESDCRADWHASAQ